MIRSWLRWIGFALALGLAVAGGVLVWTRLDPRLPNDAEIRAQIERIGTLRTGEYLYRDVVFFDGPDRPLGIRVTELLFSVELVVSTGVDLTTGVQANAAGAGTLAVTVPAPRIVRVDADEQTIEQLFVRERLASIDFAQVGSELERAKERVASDAVQRGALRRAESRAREVIDALARSRGYSGAEVTFVATHQDAQ